MADFFELRREEQSNSYTVLLDKSSNKDAALLTYKNYINLCDDWMRTQASFYGRLKEKYIELIKLIDES